MNKTFTASIAAITVLATSATAAKLAQDVAVPVKVNATIAKQHAQKNARATAHKVSAKVVGDQTTTDDGVTYTTIFEENFDKFTAGSEAAPDATSINDAEGAIDTKYFANDGWSGFGVHQAGGIAYLAFEEDSEYTGMLATPGIDTTTPVKISLRVRGVEGTTNNSVALNVEIQGDDDAYTMDGWQFYIDQDWQEVNFLTTYSGESNHIFIYPNDYTQGIYIDYIKVERMTIENTPVVYDETDVTSNSFTINWKDEFGYYDIAAYATHAAKANETYTLMDADFSSIYRGTDIEDPEFDEDYDELYPDLEQYSGILGWTLQFPRYIDGAICLSGEWSDEGYYGAIVSPSLDLSHNGGKVNLSIKTKGFELDGERFNVQLLTLENGAWVRKFAKGYDITEDWTDLNVTLDGGGETSVIQIVYGGQYVMAIESLKVTQDLAAGDEITVPVASVESYFPGYDYDDDDDWDEWDDYAIKHAAAKAEGQDDESTISYNVTIPDRYVGDTYSYRVRGNVLVYFLPDNSDDWYYWKGITGNWSDLKVVANNTGVKDNIVAENAVKVYRSGNAITVVNPDAAEVLVYNAAGALVGRSNSSVATFTLTNGVYIVKAGASATKIAM